MASLAETPAYSWGKNPADGKPQARSTNPVTTVSDFGSAVNSELATTWSTVSSVSPSNTGIRYACPHDKDGALVLGTDMKIYRVRDGHAALLTGATSLLGDDPNVSGPAVGAKQFSTLFCGVMTGNAITKALSMGLTISGSAYRFSEKYNQPIAVPFKPGFATELGGTTKIRAGCTSGKFALLVSFNNKIAFKGKMKKAGDVKSDKNADGWERPSSLQFDTVDSGGVKAVACGGGGGKAFGSWSCVAVSSHGGLG